MSDTQPEVTPAQNAEYEARLERCKPVAAKLLSILSKHQEAGSIAMGDNDEVTKSLTPVTEEVIGLFLAEDISWSDRKFVFQLALQPIAHLGERLETALEISWDRALTNLWGKEAMDLKFSDVHTALGGTPTV